MKGTFFCPTIRRWGRCVALAALLATASGAVGCRRDDGADEGDTASLPQAGAPASDVDRLRSLPYVGFVDDTKAEDGAGVVLLDPTRAQPGYNLYTVQMLSLAELVDNTGRLVRRWRHEPSDRWERAELLSSGDLLAIGVEPFADAAHGPTDEARYLLRLNWEGQVLWKKKLVCHHDVERTPRGELLVMSFQRRLFPQIHVAIETRDDLLRLLDDDGNVLDTVSFLEVIRTHPQLFPLQGVLSERIGGAAAWIDLFHSNSVEWMPFPDLAQRHSLYDPDHVLVCSRHQDRVFIFNWRTKELVWAWGLGVLSGPHDAHWLDNGHILVFDNGIGRGWSRVIELDPISQHIVWEYKAENPKEFFTVSKGSCQRLPNGNTLIANSDLAKAFEVTPGGDVVWSFVCPHQDEKGRRAAIVRMIRYEGDVIDRILKAHGNG